MSKTTIFLNQSTLTDLSPGRKRVFAFPDSPLGVELFTGAQSLVQLIS